ncbi:MAG: hypothetical protein M0Z91_05070 [Actinomycetota bacterium]|nr:hypothetical protein [Actinomycetota bacterium]
MNSPGQQWQAIRLRLERAEEHLNEIESLVGAFAAQEPFRLQEARDAQTGEWVYALELALSPSDKIPVVVGDFLHNVRSALNYLLIGMLPTTKHHRSLQYPISLKDPFGRDPATRRYLDRDPRVRRPWRILKSELQPGAYKIVWEFQPFSAGIRPGEVNMLAMLGQLSNADKHRRLAVVSQGLEDPGWVIKTGDREAIRTVGGRVAPPGKEFLRLTQRASMRLTGSPLVILRAKEAGGGEPAQDIRIGALRDLLLFVRGVLVEILVGYIQ